MYLFPPLLFAPFPFVSRPGLTLEFKFSPFPFRYNVIFMVLTYVLPIGSMTFTYARIGLELWGSQSIGENTAGQLEGIRSKRRVRSCRTTDRNISLVKINKFPILFNQLIFYFIHTLVNYLSINTINDRENITKIGDSIYYILFILRV